MSDLVSFDGTRLHVESRGPVDAPPVVLVNGVGLSIKSWGRVPDLLSRAHHVLNYDLRGHGESADAASGAYDVFAHAGDLRTVLESLPEPQRAVLVGHSFGGLVILALAKQNPSRQVAGVVFAGSGGSSITLPGFPARHVPDRAERLLRAGWVQALRGTAHASHRIRQLHRVGDWAVRRTAFEPAAPQEAVDLVRQDFMGTRSSPLARTVRASGSRDGLNWAPCLTAPTLVLHGECDPQVKSDEARELVSRLPNAKLVELPAAGHMLPLTRGPLVAEHVARWVREVGTAHMHPTPHPPQETPWP